MAGPTQSSSRSAAAFEANARAVKASIEEIADHLWRRNDLRPNSLVPMLEAANCFRDQRRKEQGLNAEATALRWFWDRLAETLLNGEFDGDATIFVLDNPGIFGTRRRPYSEHGYRLTSDHMRELTADMYSYDDVVGGCLARSWCSLDTALDWCDRQDLPLPLRWRPEEARKTQPRPSPTPSPKHTAKEDVTRPPAKRGPVDRSKHLLVEVKKRKTQHPGRSLGEVIAEVLREATASNPSAQLPTAQTIRRRYYGKG